MTVRPERITFGMGSFFMCGCGSPKSVEVMMITRDSQKGSNWMPDKGDRIIKEKENM
ncbi:MAG: hypothetical protein K2I10_01710 [Lachnospiraceae bacterium]|nr:hypothetical protein [Lachnospiraceae bacterium]